MSYKSRGNYAPGIDMNQEQWDKIFGKKEKVIEGNIVNASSLKIQADFRDGSNFNELKKLGKEVNRMKQLGESHRVEKEFGREANRLCEKKQDNTLTKQIASEITYKLRRN